MEIRIKQIIIILITILIITSFAWRLYTLQIVKGDEYLELSEKNFLRNLPIPAPRGEIYSQEGEILARDTLSYVVSVVPSDVVDIDRTVIFLSSTLEVPVDKIMETLSDTSTPFYYPRPIAVGAPIEKVLKVKVRESDYPGVKVEMYPVREYLRKSTFAHVTGYVQEIDLKDLQNLSLIGYTPGDRIGKAGIERKYEAYLKGEKGERIFKVDASGKDRTLLNETLPEKGNSITLTISSFLQERAEEVMKDINGALVIMNPKTGEILSMVSNPTFDPGYFIKGLTPSIWADWNKKNVLVNRAIQGQYPPGSTFKPFVGLSALESKKINDKFVVNCTGSIIAGRRTFKCWIYPGGHGNVDMREALAVSCNIFFFTVAQELGIDMLAKYVRQYGFGEITGVDLLSEATGLVPDTSWKLEKKNEPWYLGDTLNAGIGQGFLLVTPLQMAVMYSFLANGGQLVTPYLVNEIHSPKGDLIYSASPKLKNVMLSSKNLNIIKDGLRRSVTRGGGLSPLNELPIEVSAKTGTAQTHAGGKPHLWISAYAPSNDPEVVIVLLAEKSDFEFAYYLAPYMKKIFEAWLEYKSNILNH